MKSIKEKEEALKKLFFFQDTETSHDFIHLESNIIDSLKRDITVVAGGCHYNETSRFEFDNIIGSTEFIENFQMIPSYYVEKISLKGAVWGKLEVRKRCLYFAAENNGKKPENQDKYRFGTKSFDFIETKNKKKIWRLCDINKVFSRTYNHHDCALEIFTVESKAYFFNIFFRDKRDDVLHKLKFFNHSIEVITNKRKAFKATGIQEKWAKGEISNFEYLIQLNTYAG